MGTDRVHWGDLLRRGWRRFQPYQSGLIFDDNPVSWAQATDVSRGYADEQILERVLKAQLRVAAGEAAYERDGVSFVQPEYSWPVVMGTLLARSPNRDHVRVLDFGGSLGTAYFQNRALIPEGISVSWDVIEQPHYVEAGNHHFRTRELSFHDDMNSYLAHHQPDFCLVGSSLQYVEDPHGVLGRLAGATLGAMLLDRLPVGLTSRFDLPVIERVPDSIYPGEYPMWVFASDGLLRDLSESWTVRWSFDSLGGKMRTRSGIRFKWRGWLLTRTNPLDQVSNTDG